MYLSGALIMAYNLWRTIQLPSVAKTTSSLIAPPAAALMAAE